MNTLLAALMTLALDCRPETVETYFLPFDDLRADVTSMHLTDEKGRDVRFSLDERLMLRYEKDAYRPRPDSGWFARQSAPADENRFRRLGWLSFKAGAGVRKVRLSFDSGSGRPVARPDVAVRPWWIDLVASPLIPVDGQRLTKNVGFERKAFGSLEKTGGRRLVGLVRSRADAPLNKDGCIFFVNVPDGFTRGKSALRLFFRPEDEWTDVCGEGQVVGVTPVSVIGKHASSISLEGNASVEVSGIALQSPPMNEFSGVTLSSCVYFASDDLVVNAADFEGERIYPYRTGGVEGERVVEASDVSCSVCVRPKGSGNVVRREEGVLRMPLSGLPPGTYRAEVAFCAAGVPLASDAVPFRIIPGIDWGKEVE